MLSLGNRGEVATLAAVAAVGTATWWLLRKQYNKSAIDRRNHVSLELLNLEKFIVKQKETPITTVTFFTGDYRKAAEQLKRRLLEILRLNPWLTGRIEDSFLVFPYYQPGTQPELPEGMFEVCDSESELGRRLSLHRNTPYGKMSKALEPLLVETGRCDVVWRVSIVPDAQHPSKRFALVTSLSHAAGDGHTYYKLQNMLWGSKGFHALNPIRKSHVEMKIEERVKTKTEFFTPAYYANLLLGVLYGKISEKCVVDMSFVDERWVKSQKASLKDVQGTNEGVEFISTNDAVTSWFMTKTENMDVGVMAINFRNRLPDCSSGDAGNYENMIYYLPPDYASPALIRKSLATFHRAGGPPETRLSGWQKLKAHQGLITNWSTFVEPSSIQGCVQDLHLPVYDVVKVMPYSWTLCILFKPTPDSLGLYLAGRPSKIKRLREEWGARGEAIDVKLP